MNCDVLSIIMLKWLCTFMNHVWWFSHDLIWHESFFYSSGFSSSTNVISSVSCLTPSILRCMPHRFMYRALSACTIFETTGVCTGSIHLNLSTLASAACRHNVFVFFFSNCSFSALLRYRSSLILLIHCWIAQLCVWLTTPQAGLDLCWVDDPTSVLLINLKICLLHFCYCC